MNKDIKKIKKKFHCFSLNEKISCTLDYHREEEFHTKNTTLSANKLVYIYVSYMENYKAAPAIKKPNNTDKAIAITPGTKNGWLNTYLPIRVEPVSSISTAAIKVG